MPAQCVLEKHGLKVLAGARTTRAGKTRLAELPVTQVIRRGEVVIVFDPKGASICLAVCMPKPSG